LQFVEVQDQELLEKIYRFRYFIACEELGVYKKEDYPDGIESDEYDAYAVHFAASDEKGEVASCVRLIHHSPVGYPTQNILDVDLSAFDLDPQDVGEISRIFIRPDCRNLKASREIFIRFKIMLCHKMKELGLKYTMGSLEYRFYRLLQRYKFPYEIIGESAVYAGRERFPVLLSTDRLREANRELCEGMTTS
jgi:N-acyl-L-homoserine lactone synthetase